LRRDAIPADPEIVTYRRPWKKAAIVVAGGASTGLNTLRGAQVLEFKHPTGSVSAGVQHLTGAQGTTTPPSPSTPRRRPPKQIRFAEPDDDAAMQPQPVTRPPADDVAMQQQPTTPPVRPPMPATPTITSETAATQQVLNARPKIAANTNNNVSNATIATTRYPRRHMVASARH
jgi:hypothetical protein